MKSTRLQRIPHFLVALCLAAAGTLATGLASAQEVRLRASHQWPGGQGDIRDEMVQIIAREAKAADVGLEIRVYPGASLYKPREQWNAMARDRLDISAFPLAYAGGQHPEFNLTLMPGLVKNHDHAQRLNDSEFMDRIVDIMNEDNVIVLAHTWLAGGFVTKGDECILEPDDVEGMQMRAAGKSFNQLLAAAGASIASMPSSEIYSALQTGVLDGANTSSSSFVSYRIYEQAGCLTAPGDNALWFMYEPILMSKASFERLDAEQQEVLREAGKKAEDFAYEAAKEADQKLVNTYERNGVKVVTMNAEQFQMWRDVAQRSSYDAFVEETPNGQELLDLALSVD
jgi:TRAP-type C4-dicarboxylate transport system substrate-binding protein